MWACVYVCVRDAALRCAEQDEPRSGTALLRARRLGWADLIEGDLLVIPVLNVEEHHHPAVLVSAGQDARVAGLNGAAHGLGGQVVEELGVLLPKVHVACGERHKSGRTTAAHPDPGSQGSAGGAARDGVGWRWRWRDIGPEPQSCRLAAPGAHMGQVFSSKGGERSAAPAPARSV